MRKLPYFEGQPYQKYSPNVFDDSLSLYEQIIAFIEFLNQVIDNSNEVTEEIILIRKQFEEFKDDIENRVLPENLEIILNRWLETGKLDTVINEALFKGKSEIITSVTEPINKNNTTYWNEVLSVSYLPEAPPENVIDGIEYDEVGGL